MSNDPTAAGSGELSEIIHSLLGPLPRSVLLWDAYAAIRSELAKAAYSDEAIEERFGARRLWVPASTARTRSELVAAIAATPHIAITGSLYRGVLEYLRERPTLLVIDGIDTSGSGDLIAIDELAADLMELPTVALLTTAQTWQRAFSIPWTRLVRLVGHSNAGEAAQTAAASEALIGSTAAVREFVSLLMHLPDGASPALLDVLPDGRRVAAEAQSTGFVEDENGRLRLTSSVPGSRPDPISSSLRMAARDYFFHLVERDAPLLGKTGGAEATNRLVTDVRNIEAFIRSGLEDNDITAARVAVRFANFIRHTATGDVNLVDRARMVARGAGDKDLESKCSVLLADIALSRFQHDDARKLYEDVIPILRDLHNYKAESTCYRSLGRIALRTSDFIQAETWFEQARSTSEAHEDVAGAASAIELLGDVQWGQNRTDPARALYGQAIERYNRAEQLLGQGNCWLSLAEINISHRRLDEAQACIEKALALHREAGHRLGVANGLFLLGELEHVKNSGDGGPHFEEALTMFRALGNVKNEATCALRLAEISLEQGTFAVALTWCAEAAVLYRRFGDLPGEARTWVSAGDIALRQGNRYKALDEYRRALAVYERYNDKYWLGNIHRKMAKASAEPVRSEHRALAANCWQEIGRRDLIDELDAELSSSS